MKILVAEETSAGFRWAIHYDETKTVPNPAYDPRETIPDPRYVVLETWGRLERNIGESDKEYAARKVEYVQMQKRELQLKCDAIANSVTATMDIEGQIVDRLIG
jgi:hypothetical protein